jgi:hypothetical protein
VRNWLPCREPLVYVVLKISKVGNTRFIRGLFSFLIGGKLSRKKCPYCAELVKAEAVYCKWCKNSLGGRELLTSPQGSSSGYVASSSSTQMSKTGRIWLIGIIGSFIVLLTVLAFVGNEVGANSVSDSGYSASSNVQGESSSTGQSRELPIQFAQMNENEARWGTLCQYIMSSGWNCVVDLSVINAGKQAWSGTLSATLVATDGSTSIATDSPDNGDLTGFFAQTVNPGDKWEWMVNFEVGENKTFRAMQIIQDGSVVSSVPICLSSSDSKTNGC